MRFLRLAAVAALVAAATGCSGGESATETSPATTSAAATTSPATSATATTRTDDTVGSTPDTVPDGPLYPLTGLPVTDPGAAERPAMVVKIDNNAAARPQSGLNDADIVFEEIVEVQTRFAAVFQSHGADPVGPIRSGRTQDIDLLGSFAEPLFVWSGGNKNVTKAIDNSDLVSISAQNNASATGGGFYRGSQHRKPHNLYAQSSLVWTLAPDDAQPPPPQFQYLAAGQVLAADPASGATGDMDGLAIEWTFDPATGQYLRTNGGTPHLDELGGQVTTSNVVVLTMQYRPSPADARSPEAQTIGTGEAMVFTSGTVVTGSWTRDDRLAPFELSTDDGTPVLLTPGRTWVELARADSFEATP